MLPFGHVGITSAAVRMIDIAFPPRTTDTHNRFVTTVSSVVTRFRNGTGVIDYRMVIIGSMLPDIVDKTLFLLVDNSPYIAGRGICHSLLFNLLILAVGVVSRRSWLLLLWFGSLMHLLLDRIWELPVTLFWPFMGWFAIDENEGWFSFIRDILFSDPKAYIPEIIGVIIVGIFAFRLIKNRGIIRFIRKGIVV